MNINIWTTTITELSTNQPPPVVKSWNIKSKKYNINNKQFYTKNNPISKKGETHNFLQRKHMKNSNNSSYVSESSE